MGLVGVVHREEQRSVSMYCRVFQEYADEGWIKRYFDDLLDNVRKLAMSQGLHVIPASDPQKN